MTGPTRRMGILVLAASIVIMVAMAAVWAIAPEDVRGMLLLAGGLLWAAAIVGGYVVERRVHW